MPAQISALPFRNGQYTSSRRLSRFTDPGKLATHLPIATSVTALLAFATKGSFLGSPDFSRLLVGSSLAIFLVLGAPARVALAVRQRSLFMKGVASWRVLVLGTGQTAGDFVVFLAKRPWLGVACVRRLGYRLPADKTGEGSIGVKTAFSLTPSYEGLEELDRFWYASEGH